MYYTKLLECGFTEKRTKLLIRYFQFEKTDETFVWWLTDWIYIFYGQYETLSEMWEITVNNERLRGKQRNIDYVKAIGLRQNFIEELYDKYDNDEGYQHPLYHWLCIHIEEVFGESMC